MDDWRIYLTVLPLMGYVLAFAATTKTQMRYIPDRRHSVLDQRMTANLALVGLSFTVVGLLVSFFKDDLELVFRSVLLFSLAVAFFMASYICLHLRIRRAFDFASGALTSSGLWVILLGLREMFLRFSELESISILFTGLLSAFGTYVLVDLFLTIKVAWRGLRSNTDIACPRCWQTVERTVLAAGTSTTDIGSIRCSSCSFELCACESHGVYECPPPCPDCSRVAA